MLKRLILFLIRRELGIRKYRYFVFDNQKSKDIYIFMKEGLVKYVKGPSGRWYKERAGVSLVWLLDDECNIIEVDVVNICKQ